MAMALVHQYITTLQDRVRHLRLKTSTARISNSSSKVIARTSRSFLCNASSFSRISLMSAEPQGHGTTGTDAAPLLLVVAGDPEACCAVGAHIPQAGTRAQGSWVPEGRRRDECDGRDGVEEMRSGRRRRRMGLYAASFQFVGRAKFPPKPGHGAPAFSLNQKRVLFNNCIEC